MLYIGDDVHIQGEIIVTSRHAVLYFEILVCSGVLPYIEEQYCLTEHAPRDKSLCNAVKSQRKIGKKESYTIVEITEQTNLFAFL